MPSFSQKKDQQNQSDCKLSSNCDHDCDTPSQTVVTHSAEKLTVHVAKKSTSATSTNNADAVMDRGKNSVSSSPPEMSSCTDSYSDLVTLKKRLEVQVTQRKEILRKLNMVKTYRSKVSTCTCTIKSNQGGGWGVSRVNLLA
jgi:hypothetical protein